MVERRNKILNRKKEHARGRAEERYGLCLTNKELKALSLQIRSDSIRRSENAVFITLLTNSRTLWAVKHNDLWYPVVYDKKSHLIVSFLPQDALELEQCKDFLPVDFNRKRE